MGNEATSSPRRWLRATTVATSVVGEGGVTCHAALLLVQLAGPVALDLGAVRTATAERVRF